MTDMRVRVLSVQTKLLGNKTYGELLRRRFAASERIEFDAHWNDEQTVLRIPGLKRLFWTRPPSAWLRARNLDLYPMRYELGTSLLARRVLAREVRARRPDVLHLHSQCIGLLAGDFMARTPTVLSADMTMMQAAEQQTAAGWRWTYRPSFALERAAFHRAAAIVVFSEWAARSVIVGHGVPPARVHVLPPGVDTAWFARLAARRAARPPNARTKILFIGGDFERKGGPALVRVFRERFAAEGCELHLVSGAAPAFEDPQITVHRDVAAYSSAWEDLYVDADVFVMPTRGDASPHVYVEAMAAGLPVIGTSVGSAAETIVDGLCGFLLAPDDDRALAERLGDLVGDPQLRRIFGEHGRARVAERFDAEANGLRLEDLFAALAAER